MVWSLSSVGRVFHEDATMSKVCLGMQVRKRDGFGGRTRRSLVHEGGGGECGMPLVLYNANQRGRTGRKFVKNLGHHVMERRCAISSIDQS